MKHWFLFRSHESCVCSPGILIVATSSHHSLITWPRFPLLRLVFVSCFYSIEPRFIFFQFVLNIFQIKMENYYEYFAGRKYIQRCVRVLHLCDNQEKYSTCSHLQGLVDELGEVGPSVWRLQQLLSNFTTKQHFHVIHSLIYSINLHFAFLLLIRVYVFIQ